MSADAARSPTALERVEHHEVPEGRTVTGVHMTFKSSVFGEVVSDGGKVHLEDVLGWGKALSHGGHIRIPKRAFNATIEAAGGVVDIDVAESCFIVGQEVRIRQAINCRIVAHKLTVTTAVGCQIMARDVGVRSAKPHKGEPTVVTLVVPDLPELDSAIQAQQALISQAQAQVAVLTARMDALKADAAFTHYLVIRSKVRTGAVTLTAEQHTGFAQMDSRFGPTAQALEAAASEKRAVVKSVAEAQAQLTVLTDERAARLADCRCQIAQVEGDTIVRSTALVHEDRDVSQLPGETITQTFIRNGPSVKMVFSAAQGRVDWVLPG